MLIAAMGPDGDLVTQRLARGCRCFAAWDGGELAGYGWLSTGPEWIGELQVEITPRSGEGYIWNCVTLPEHRRQGVFTALVAGIMAVAAGEGFKRLWIGSVAIPAEKALAPLGFTPALRFRSMEVFGLHLMTVEHSPRRDLVLDACSALALRARKRVWRSRRRRH